MCKPLNDVKKTLLVASGLEAGCLIRSHAKRNNEACSDVIRTSCSGTLLFSVVHSKGDLRLLNICIFSGPSGSRVAWTCTIVSLLIICVCGILIYHNRMRDGLPDYATMGWTSLEQSNFLLLSFRNGHESKGLLVKFLWRLTSSFASKILYALRIFQDGVVCNFYPFNKVLF